MNFRYQYTASLLSTTGGGFDRNNNPVKATETWTDFSCDVQVSSGKAVQVQADRDKIPVNYEVFVPTSSALTFARGGKIKYNDVVYTILQVHVTRLNIEIWL